MFSGGKGTFYEGALRVPFIAHWPGVIAPDSINHDVLSLMDLLPTIHSLTNSVPDENKHLDGQSFIHALTNSLEEHGNTQYRFLPFFCDSILMCARYGPFKIHFRTLNYAKESTIARYLRNGILPGLDWYLDTECATSEIRQPPLLYNVEQDPGESFPLDLIDYMEIFEEIMLQVKVYKQTMKSLPPALLVTETMTPHVVPCCNPPYCMCFEDLWNKSVCPVL